MTKSELYLFVISVGLLLFFFVLIVYTWFYKFFTDLTTARVKKRLEEIVISLFNKENKEANAIKELNSFVKTSAVRKEALINIIIDYGDDFIKSNNDLLIIFYEVTGIKEFLIKRLTSKNIYIKSLACRQLGALRLKNTEEYILKLSSCKNNDVRYNVLLALAKLGDVKGLVYVLTNNTENIMLSYRAVIEIISAFDGPKEDLFKKTLELSDNYIKGILIKAAADYKFESLREYYLKYLKSDDINLRIACIRALCELGNSADEVYIIDMIDDEDWKVRAASAKGLGKIGTSHSFKTLENAISDRAWWVRHNGATALISLPGGREYASRIIDGNDNFAREAVISVMEMRAVG